MSNLIEPFPLHIPQAQLDDLAQRLVQTRWPDPETVCDNSQGPQLESLRALVEPGSLLFKNAPDSVACLSGSPY
ncbi:epoxide hydrolase N-terminal domain-containing protein [Halomonas sp. KO116]|uniref:epoxide hydrolase N-terminal domain-containing protein n=1 Tax=Halomonas sp. KO116 TaxID=1504981 RepID=UPI0004E454B8|nr:epoxide hydrolase N-terminal domain-containing protein [Halomonas sp. KO116]AJY51973.1 Epoxide hydrolase domain protein [Halomonas sp. KO116]